MKWLLMITASAGLIAGCASPGHNDRTSRLGYNDSYGVVGDPRDGDYPVTYRTKRTDYIIIPDGLDDCVGGCGGGK